MPRMKSKHDLMQDVARLEGENKELAASLAERRRVIEIMRELYSSCVDRAERRMNDEQHGEQA